MIIYYTHEDLASFGAYMVSQERTNRIKAQYEPEKDNWTLEERLANIYQLDVDTWISIRKSAPPEQIPLLSKEVEIKGFNTSEKE